MDKTLSRQRIHMLPALPVAPIPAKATACLLSMHPTDKVLLGTVASSDPGILLALLRAVRSIGRPVTINHLLDRLGEAELRAALQSMVSAFDRGHQWPAVLESIWRDSLAASLCAEQLAEMTGGCTPGEACIGGLLCHVGRYAMAVIDPDGYTSIRTLMTEECLSETEAEMRVFGMAHGTAGKRLADAYRLPRWLADTIWLHGTAVEALPSRSFPSELIAIVGAATRLANIVLGAADTKSSDLRNAYADHLKLSEADLITARAAVVSKFRERVELLEELGAKPPARERSHSARRVLQDFGGETSQAPGERLKVSQALNLLHRRLADSTSYVEIADGCAEALRDAAGVQAGAIVIESESPAGPAIRLWPATSLPFGDIRGRTANLPDTELTSDATVENDILLFLSQRAASSSNAALLQIPITAPDGRRLGFIAVLVPSDLVGLHASTCREAAIACAHAAAQQAREAETDERIVALMESLADFYGARRTEGEPVEPANSAVPAAPPTALASAAQSLEKPLGAILSELRRLQAQIQDPATYQSLSGMTRQCRKLGSILDDMRFLSGSEPPDYSVSLLNVPIRLYMRSARQNLERSGISVVEKYSDGLPRVHMDSRRIVHALANVLAFVEQKLDGIGGDVTILTDAAADRSLAWVRVKIEGHASANPLDAGPVNWSSLDIRSEMGLAYEVCQSILSEHGGRFSIEASEHTADFTMALPAALGAATVKVDDHAPSAAHAVGDNVVSVLIADDDDSVRDILRQALRMRGYRTEVARDGVEALNCLIEKHIDVVLLDLLMPNRDGLAVLRELQRRDSPPPVIFMTGNGAPDVREEALALGAHAFLQKPFELRRLLAEIESVLIKK